MNAGLDISKEGVEPARVVVFRKASHPISCQCARSRRKGCMRQRDCMRDSFPFRAEEKQCIEKHHECTHDKHNCYKGYDEADEKGEKTECCACHNPFRYRSSTWPSTSGRRWADVVARTAAQ
ncbi:hypothetical protein AVEN_168661-1 [Araneus ventricosus]|uniref:Uncharacterized protein n=1 Tax=Araneus ventricosus TaxID=182803 RepID=A0A4Y2QWP8_ARAVE|nr:hypothetical protein AVEN_168661-1 [Araneus ventricosus]